MSEIWIVFVDLLMAPNLGEARKVLRALLAAGGDHE